MPGDDGCLFAETLSLLKPFQGSILCSGTFEILFCVLCCKLSARVLRRSMSFLCCTVDFPVGIALGECNVVVWLVVPLSVDDKGYQQFISTVSIHSKSSHSY